MIQIRVITVTLFCALNSNSADARFLQVDPIGYEDQINLYAYVENDPTNKIDPRGTDAIVVINSDTDIEITLPMTFTGDAATTKNINAAISNIEIAWTGNFDGINVKTSVVQGTSPLDSFATNTMEITSGPTSHVRSDGNIGHSYVMSGYKGATTLKDVQNQPLVQANGTITRSEKGVDTYAHEGGHYMGAPDSGPNTGLMGPGSGSRPTGDDIRQIMNERTATGGTNTIIDNRKKK